MAETTTLPPRRRPDLIVRPYGEQGEFVVKDPTERTYFQLGEQEVFLLECLDGEQTTDTICRAFEDRFHEPLSAEDFDGFLELARDQRLVETNEEKVARAKSLGRTVKDVLYWRRRVIDPDAILNWMEPRTRWLFTSAFFFTSLVLILLAGAVFYTQREEFIQNIPRTWDVLFLIYFTVFAATMLHEFAHGLMCKHHGGEVHEIGVLLVFLMPCFYCDVSDAWLFREKSKRLWVTLAGTYCDLCLWAIGVFLWRLTMPDTLPGAISSVIVSVCGVRVFFNAIPLLKLDGYYFVSDLFSLPNLRSRSFDRFFGHLRWIFWGAPRPEPDPRGGVLLIFGAVSWGFSFFFLVLMLTSLFRHLVARWGPVGTFGVAFLGWLSLPRMLVGLSKGEIMNMFRTRPRRLALWGILLVVAGLVLALVPMQERAHGQFRVRPNSRAEIRAPISGFLQVVHLREGQEVSTGATIVRLEIPDLDSKISEKKAEIEEARAKLRLLEAGPRREEVEELRSKARRAKDWRDLAEQDLRRKRRALEEELTRLTETIKQYTIELDNARENLDQSRKLFERKALALDQLRDWDKRFQVAQAQVNQARAQHREREVVGTQDHEAELARREKEHADVRAALALMEIGTRPEEIEAQRSLLARLEESHRYLTSLQRKLDIGSPVAGVITTPHLQEKIGSYFKEGDLICEVENISDLEVEIPMLEQEVGFVHPGFPVELKARALPFVTLQAKVDRIAPAAMKSEKPELVILTPTTQSTITVYCHLTDVEASGLHPGMTGYARISCGQHSCGRVLATRLLRYLRTEFWW